MPERLSNTPDFSINHPANREFRNAYIQNFSIGVPLQAQDILYQYPETITQTIEHFKRHIARTYDQKDRLMIYSALDLAIVAHERNGIVQNRTRKDKVTPYIKHPVEIAAALAGMDRTLNLSITDQEETCISLPVHQHPYKAEVVAAGLLHDVVEDVYLPLNGASDEKIKVTIGRKQRDIHWPEVISEHLKLAGATEQQLRTINTMIQAVTKYYHHDFPSNVREGIVDSDLFSMFTYAVLNRTPNKNPLVVEREVIRTLSDLHRMFAVCFPRGTEGAPQITNETIQQFFGALAIKLHDIENNLETGVRDDKIIRAHLLAHLARFFGFPIASRLGVHLVVNNEYDITRTGVGVKEDALKMVQNYCVEENNPSLRPVLKIGPFEIKPEATQIPITTYAEQRTQKGDRRHRSVLQYKCTVSDDFFAYLGQAEVKGVSVGDAKGYQLHRINTNIQDLIREFGRQVEYYRIEGVDGESVGVARFQDNQPNAHSVIAEGSTIDAKKVPEHRLLNVFDGTSGSTMEILAKMSPLRFTY